MDTISRYPVGKKIRQNLSVSETNFLRFMQKFKMAAKVVGNDFLERSPVDSDIRYLESKMLRD